MSKFLSCKKSSNIYILTLKKGRVKLDIII